ncbi:MAG TPA: stage II sporulation protein R [Clostridiaceae bacterium]|nr:stage II sporulation protein R [Clostridiaceae bacterium]
MKINGKKIFAFLDNTGSIIQFLSAASRFLLAVLLLCVLYGGTTQGKIAGSVVRLHIIANSDDPADQELKLKVRDAILTHMQEKYPDGADRDEAAEYLKNSLPEIRRIATGVMRENGSDKPVNVKYGVYSFPTREYDGLTLPAGMYEAVRVELGEAKGQNWWCIMFPPLCVADASSLNMDEDAMGQLRRELGDYNYRLITDYHDKGNIPVRIKFRIIELIENSRIRLAELISRLF